jgi:hypothetical protein
MQLRHVGHTDKGGTSRGAAAPPRLGFFCAAIRDFGFAEGCNLAREALCFGASACKGKRWPRPLGVRTNQK